MNESESLNAENIQIDSVHRTAQEWQAYIGHMLAQAREERNLSVAHISEELKYRIKQIQALEKGAWNELPAPVFTRGFVRNYARLVGVDQNINALLNKAYPESVAPAHNPIAAENERIAMQQSQETFRLTEISTKAKVLAGVMLAIILVILWQNHSTKNTQKAEEQQTTTALVPEIPAVAEDNVAIVPMPAPQIQTASEVATNDAPVIASTDTSASAAASNTEPVSLQDTLLISIRKRTLLYVSDADQKVLFNQVVSGGSKHQFTGKPPYTVRITDATGSFIELNGKVYDVAPYLNGDSIAISVPPKPNKPKAVKKEKPVVEEEIKETTTVKPERQESIEWLDPVETSPTHEKHEVSESKQNHEVHDPVFEETPLVPVEP